MPLKTDRMSLIPYNLGTTPSAGPEKHKILFKRDHLPMKLEYREFIGEVLEKGISSCVRSKVDPKEISIRAPKSYFFVGRTKYLPPQSLYHELETKTDSYIRDPSGKYVLDKLQFCKDFRRPVVGAVRSSQNNESVERPWFGQTISRIKVKNAIRQTMGCQHRFK